MSREWKPGDVARCLLHGEVILRSEDGGWAHPGYKVPQGISDSQIRTLTVIDPEDNEQIARLCDLLYGGHAGEVGARVLAALREFANPTPPKPDEPQGLGAVVEDAEGKRYIRIDLGHLAPWRADVPRDDRRPFRYYADLDVVRVLSEGVTP